MTIHPIATQRTDTRTVLVTGATGNQGGAVARRLLAEQWRVRALTRDPASPAARALADAGAQVVRGDMGDEVSVLAAAEGVYGIFSVQQGALAYPPVSFEEEIRQGVVVSTAAAKMGVAHLVYSSVATPDFPAGVAAFESKRRIEDHIQRLGVPATVLRPVSFMENYANPAFGVQTGTLASPFAPEVPEQLIALADIGAFAALAFARPDRFLGTTVAIAGDALTPPQIAARLSEATRRPIGYQHIPIDAVRALSHHLADAAAFLNNGGGYGADIGHARSLYPPLMSFDAWLADGGQTKVDELFDTAADQHR
jgi:uncharacterized protein YbjT (DUF2867 family)